MHELRVGLWTPNGLAWDDLVEQWQLIESLGFDCSGLADHLMPTTGNIEDPYHEGWTALTALAALTPRLRIAVLVTGNTYRNPALVAKMAATLDHVSGGRLDLGLGAGWYEPEHTAYGFPFPPPGERVEMLREAVTVIKSLMRGGRTTFEGRYYQLHDAPFAPLPVQPGGLPIMIGAQGDRMLRLVAEQADIWNLNHSPDKMRELGAVLNRHCNEIGRDPSEIRWSAFSFPAVVKTDPFSSVDAFVELVRDYITAGASEVALRMPSREQWDTLRRSAEQLPAIHAEYASRQMN